MFATGATDNAGTINQDVAAVVHVHSSAVLREWGWAGTGGESVREGGEGVRERVAGPGLEQTHHDSSAVAEAGTPCQDVAAVVHVHSSAILLRQGGRGQAQAGRASASKRGPLAQSDPCGKGAPLSHPLALCLLLGVICVCGRGRRTIVAVHSLKLVPSIETRPGLRVTCIAPPYCARGGSGQARAASESGPPSRGARWASV